MRNKMKKILLIGLLAIALVGCKDDKRGANESKGEPVQEEQMQQEAPNDNTGEYEETDLEDV